MKKSPRNRARSPLLLMLAASAPLPAFGDVIYVNDDAAPGGNGTSWQAAFRSLHDALTAANGATNPVEIWVAEGVYEPNITQTPLKTFRVARSQVHLYGGFIGDETAVGERAGSKELTILDGGDADGDGPDDAANHVLRVEPAVGGPARVTDIVIDGFRVVGGRPDTQLVAGLETGGGGLLMVSVDSAVVSNTRFEDNGLDPTSTDTDSAVPGSLGGGAVLLYNCAPDSSDEIVFHGVDFAWLDETKCDGKPDAFGSPDPPSNSSHTVGGAVAIRDDLSFVGDPEALGLVTFTDCTFCGNWSRSGRGATGGAIAILGARGNNVTVEGTISATAQPALFLRNVALGGLTFGGGGGAIALEGNSSLTVTDADFQDNKAFFGGAVCVLPSNMTGLELRTSDFTWNRSFATGTSEARGDGGAVYVGLPAIGLAARILLQECTFTENGWARDESIDPPPVGPQPFGPGILVNFGGALFIHNGEVQDCTFTDNASLIGGGAVHGSPTRLLDCVFVDNMCKGRGGAADLGNAIGAPGSAVSRCTFQGNSAQAGGALALEAGGPVHVMNCRFLENVAQPWLPAGSAGGGGGGGDGGLLGEPCEMGTPDDWPLDNGSVQNPAVRGGAILILASGAAFRVFGCIFYGNKCRDWNDSPVTLCNGPLHLPSDCSDDPNCGKCHPPLEGAAVFFDSLRALPGFEPRSENCTFRANEITDSRTALECAPSNPVFGTWFDCDVVNCHGVVVRNCIMWDNRINGSDSVVAFSDQSTDVEYCLVQHAHNPAIYAPAMYPWVFFPSNLSSDPQLFGGAAARPRATSPVIDAGSNMHIAMRDLLDEDTDNGCTTDMPPYDVDGRSSVFRRYRERDAVLNTGQSGGPADCASPVPNEVLKVIDIGAVEFRCYADLSGSSDPNSMSYGVPDGLVDSSDFFYFLDQFVGGNMSVADVTGSSDPNDPSYGVPDGMIDGADFFFYLDRHSECAGLPAETDD